MRAEFDGSGNRLYYLKVGGIKIKKNDIKLKFYNLKDGIFP